MRQVEISPSLLAADKNNIVSEILLAEKSGAKYIHIDVMDGKFVPNLSFSVEFVKEIHDKHNLINDVHIMIENPKKFAESYLLAGADILTFHLEATTSIEEVNQIIDIIHSHNKLAGISIKPATEVKEIYPYLDKLDLVLIMSVEPGKGGQKFLENALNKISDLRKEIDTRHLKTLIEVDGGINEETGKLCKDRGADILVAGSYLYNSENFEERLVKLK